MRATSSQSGRVIRVRADTPSPKARSTVFNTIALVRAGDQFILLIGCVLLKPLTIGKPLCYFSNNGLMHVIGSVVSVNLFNAPRGIEGQLALNISIPKAAVLTVGMKGHCLEVAVVSNSLKALIINPPHQAYG